MILYIQRHDVNYGIILYIQRHDIIDVNYGINLVKSKQNIYSWFYSEKSFNELFFILLWFVEIYSFYINKIDIKHLSSIIVNEWYSQLHPPPLLRPQVQNDFLRMTFPYVNF